MEMVKLLPLKVYPFILNGFTLYINLWFISVDLTLRFE